MNPNKPKQDFRRTIEKMKATPELKAILLAQCEAGDKSALFATYALQLRQMREELRAVES